MKSFLIYRTNEINEIEEHYFFFLENYQSSGILFYFVIQMVFKTDLSLNAGQKYCKMHLGKPIAICDVIFRGGG